MTDDTAAAPAVSGARLGADRFYAYLASLTVIAVIVQLFLAGVGAFGLNAQKIKDASSFDPHRVLGDVIGVMALVLLVLALVARVSKRAMWGSLVLLLLAEPAQHALAAGGENNKWVGGLHAGDGALILLLVIWLTAESHRRLAARR